MVGTPPNIDSPEDVLSFIPDNDFDWYDHLRKDDIRDGHACNCDHDTKFGRKEDTRFYSGDKQAIYLCDGCGGYYGAVIPNWS